MAFPLVSIISVNYNQTAVTGAFLESVQHLRYPNIEVILVDNGSAEPPGEWMREHFPDVNYIETGKNLGFSGGNNVGLRAARGDFFLLVNNDTELTPDLIDQLLAHFQSDPAIGMVCPLIRYYDEPQPIQFAGYTPMHPVTARNQTIGQFEVDRGQYAAPMDTAFAHGAAMFTSREVVDRAGLMPELYFLYYEELDWSSAIKRAGYRLAVEPRALIFHKESVSVGRSSPLKTYYMTRNRVLFMRRNAAWWSWLLFLIYWSAIVTPVHSLRYIRGGQKDHLRAFWRAMSWHFLPSQTRNAPPTVPPFLLGGEG